MLVVLGAPWRLMGLARATTALAEARRRHPERLRSMAVAVVVAAAAVAWRTPPAVDLLARQPWASTLEAVTLVAGGTALWLECVASPPLFPRSSQPMRIALATVTMWVIWVLAYALGMSRSDWYPAYHHIAGHGLSLIADQEIAAGLMWAVTACCLIPLNIWILMDWLRGEEDPDEEMSRLVREERRRAS
jgi:cytochrome c oxidase assembly factor CtaG